VPPSTLQIRQCWRASWARARSTLFDSTYDISSKSRSDRACLGQEYQPGNVFDLTLPLDQVAEGYRAMDERRTIKTLLGS
jgi:hypothetical protein